MINFQAFSPLLEYTFLAILAGQTCPWPVLFVHIGTLGDIFSK